MADPFQPTLPPETTWTDAEKNFRDESPPGFFPDNQDSNLGLLRKLFSDRIQAQADQLTLAYTENFAQRSETFLDVWEAELGLPAYSGALTTVQRQSRVLSRIRKGPFTRSARAAVVEAFIQATFGEVPSFTSAGLDLTSGITLHAQAGDVSSLYDITENITNFSYAVTIDPTITVDLEGLTRELKRITPAHINFTITAGTVPGAAAKTGSDVGSGTGSGVIKVSLFGTDTGIGNESSGTIFKAGNESGLGSEAVTFQNTIPASDAGSGTQTASTTNPVAGADTGHGTDTTGTTGALAGTFGEGLFKERTFGDTVAATVVTLRDSAGSDDGGTVSASVIVTKPAGAQVGDLLVAVIACGDQTTGLNLSPPTGWTQQTGVIDTADSGQSMFVFTKIATSSDPGSWTFTINGGTPSNYAWNTFTMSFYDSGAGATLAVRNIVSQHDATPSSMASPTLVGDIDNAQLISCWTTDEAAAPPYSFTGITPSGITELYDVAETASELMLGVYQTIFSSTAGSQVHTVSKTGTRGSLVVGFAIET